MQTTESGSKMKINFWFWVKLSICIGCGIIMAETIKMASMGIVYIVMWIIYVITSTSGVGIPI
jgi:hypothetical protein